MKYLFIIALAMLPTLAHAQIVDPLSYADGLQSGTFEFQAPAGNQWAQVYQGGTLAPTNSPASYERAQMLVMSTTADPSDYANGITRDAVGIDMRGIILPGNMLGRAWGDNPHCAVMMGADGNCTGEEIDALNHGMDQPGLYTPTTKVGLKIVAQANTSAGVFGGSVNNPITAYETFAPGGSTSHNGLVAATTAFTDQNSNYLALQDSAGNTLFAVNGETGAIALGWKDRKGAAHLKTLQLNPLGVPVWKKVY